MITSNNFVFFFFAVLLFWRIEELFLTIFCQQIRFINCALAMASNMSSSNILSSNDSYLLICLSNNCRSIICFTFFFGFYFALHLCVCIYFVIMPKCFVRSLTICVGTLEEVKGAITTEKKKK